MDTSAKQPTYPCQWCGCCTIWLAAFEPGQGLETMEKVVAACKKYHNCSLVGQPVPEEVMNHAKV